ncbi:MAG: glycoside hydrolase family 3 C-terminal domain-containing protein [Bacteroidales bacterium]|nr:glycoside hydrolase family 3 C-terminal domain-containing protein [Bacteroidales bacterium]
MNKKNIILILSLMCGMALATTASAQNNLVLREDNIEEILKAMTNEEKVTLLVGGPGSLVPGAAGYTREIERLGIPMTVLADGPAGLRIQPKREGTDQTFYCTGFPTSTLLASSWDPELVETVTTAMGNEVLEYGVDVLLAPGMNLHRNPLCGRNFEYYSEDPLLSGKMAAAYVRGVQKNGVGTSVKHFAANNQETNRLENDARISNRTLRELYLKNFEIAVKEGKPWTVMSSYNKLNGEYTQQKHGLLTTVLRDEWGFNGIVMTDWGVKDGTVKSAKAGNDLMESGRQVEIDRLLAAVNEGTINQEELDRNVRRMLQYIVKTPHFKGYKFSNKPDLKAHAVVARKAAEESIILLRNECNTLPLKGSEKVALYGITSVDFFGIGTGSGEVNTKHIVNMQEAMTEAGFTLDENLAEFYRTCYATQSATEKMEGSAIDKRHRPEPIVSVKAIERQAKDNDVAVVVLGRIAGEGADRAVKDDFELTSIERELFQNISMSYHKAGKKVVVVLNIVGVIETASWKHLVDAIVLPWAPGQEGAHAVADILKGKVNPSGKLPMTFPINYMDMLSSQNFPYYWDMTKGRKGERPNVDYTDYAEGIWVGYRYFQTNNVEVSYPFGYGLSYTTFSYSKPKVKADKDGFAATITVTNVGKVAGREVVELYVAAPTGGLDKPSRELKAFAKTKLLAPGESETLTMKVSTYELASFNEEHSAWETAAGTCEVLFGSSVSDIRRTATCKMKAQSWEVHDVLGNPKE